LKRGILNDINHKFYPTSDVFAIVQESQYSFEFDLLLFHNHLKTNSKEEFEEDLNELRAKYNFPKSLEELNKIKWEEE